ncbi:hypothetical protein GCM10010222_02330 [Streptomyces tanashiensis]|nr:hypothetical protein GCM10010222_02330 [Streptomyces tanashiensis]
MQVMELPMFTAPSPRLPSSPRGCCGDGWQLETAAAPWSPAEGAWTLLSELTRTQRRRPAEPSS